MLVAVVAYVPGSALVPASCFCLCCTGVFWFFVGAGVSALVVILDNCGLTVA